MSVESQTLWSPSLPYEPGDVVVRRERQRRTVWEWITGRPARTRDVRYICVAAATDTGPPEWMPYLKPEEL